MQKLNLSLKWLEAFQMVARSGSMQRAAEECDLSISTVSHHIAKLQEHLGVDLLNTSHRPITLTNAGAIFLRSVEQVLTTLRRAEMEAKSGKLTQTRVLRLAMVEDFDSEIGLSLSRQLATGLPECEFTHLTRASHQILKLLRGNQIDVGVAVEPEADISDLVSLPLLHDPFVLALPTASDLTPQQVISGKASLPFLRYSQSQFIGKQIEAQLRRLRLNISGRFEIESNHALLGTVADGAGWAITTPASYMRAQRFHGRVTLHPFPSKTFGRTVSVLTNDTANPQVGQMISGSLQQLIRTHFIAPALTKMPWLADQFYLSDDGPNRT